MTFRSLYRLERRGLLDCPILGVAVQDWSDDELRQHARAAIEGTGEPLDDAVFARLAARMSYVAGDFGDEATYAASPRRSKGATQPGPLSRDPAVPLRHGDQGPRGGRADRGGARRRGEAVRPRPRPPRARWPRRSTATSTSRSCIASTTSSGRWARRRSSTCASPTRRSSRSGVASTWPRPDHDGRELRRRRPRPLLRPGRRAARRRRQPPHAGRRRGDDGDPADRDESTLKNAHARAVQRDRGGRPRALRTRPARGLSRHRRRRADSTTETYAALRLEIDNWRWSGVPISFGPASPAGHADRAAAVFERPPHLGFHLQRSRAPEPMLGHSAFLGRRRRTLQERNETSMSRLAVLELRTMNSAHDLEYTVRRNGPPGERPQPLLHVGRKRRRADVEAQTPPRLLPSSCSGRRGRRLGRNASLIS